MAISPEQKRRLSRNAGRAAARLIQLVHKTSRTVFEPADAQDALARHHPAIIAVWHGQFMMLASERPRSVPFAAMVARHGDAEIIGEALSILGVELIRGAGAGTRQKDRGGSHALRAALAALEGGKSIVMTADVPPGPARIAGAGIITLARLSGRPIVPAAVASSRYKALNTWSRMTINLPGSKLAYVVGAPIVVPRELGTADVEAKRLEVERSLNAITRRAYELAGADPSRATPPGRADPSDPPAKPGLGLRAYSLLTRALGPTAPVILKQRERRGKEDPARRDERLGIASVARPDAPLVWVHAASVGETIAALPLIEALSAERPDLAFLVTTGTVTSAAVAAKRLPPAVIHQFVPIDVPECVERFLDHWRPDLAILTESDIWPNLVLGTAGRGTPLVLVNARMSNASYGRWKRRPGMAKPLFNRLSLVVAQNEKLARRFTDLGARSTVTAGNLKVDAAPPPVDADAKSKLEAAIAGRPVIVAASTHDGEEAIVAGAHRKIAPRVHGLLTIIVPRHPERGAQVKSLLDGLGFRVAQRSAGSLPHASTDIYLADTIGELGMLYGMARVAFVGGSLADRGGQNPIEAIRQGAAVLTGPHWQNFTDAYRALLRHNGVVEIRNADELAVAAERLLTNSAALKSAHDGAGAALQTLGGALQRTVAAVRPYLPPDKSLQRAS